MRESLLAVEQVSNNFCICIFHFLLQEELEWGRSNCVHIKKVREVRWNT